MRRIHYVIMALVASVAISCAPKFNEEYSELRMDFTEMAVPASEGSVLLKIYYSGSWTASVPEDVSWAEIEKPSGSGITGNHVILKKNEGPLRSTDITVRADNGQEWIVKLNQNAVSDRLYLMFEKGPLELPADAFEIDMPVISNLGDSYVDAMLEGLVPESPAGMIEGVVVSEPEVMASGDSRRVVSLSLTRNETGASRQIELIAALDGYDRYGDTLKITQGAQAARIAVKDEDLDDGKLIVGGVAGSYTFELEHNLGSLADSVSVAVDADFISDVSRDGNVVSYSVSALPEGSDGRTARFTIDFKAYGVTLDPVTVNLTQVKLIERERTVENLLARFGTENEYTADDNIHSDYITLYVVGGAGNPNMDQNINTGPNEITTDENDRTLYMQDALENPARGFRVKFTDPEDNTALRHGDKVKLFLVGRTLLKEDAPERYTIGGLTSSSVEVVSRDNVIVPTRRTIASLSSANVYTYCTLENLEFQVKEGAYTNVREYNAIQNPYNLDLPKNYVNPSASVSSYSQFAMDGATNLMCDGNGKSIYTLINMGCEWRRNGNTVPEGAGSVSGVIVHQDMPRWGGNVGVYSIRPLKLDDIDLTSSSNYTTLAEWTFNSLKLEDYNWNEDGEYDKGSASDTELVQNRLHATTGQTDAVIYSENRMLQRNAATQRDYPIEMEYGYRGTDISNYTSYDKYGYSPSVVAFYANPAGWFTWDGESIVAPTDPSNNKGVVIEFSTNAVSGTVMSVGFSIASGYLDRDSKDIYANVAWQSSTSFPVYWKVQYATYENETWSQYKDAVNEATGVSGFEMRSVPWTMDGDSEYAIHYAGAKTKLYTQIDTGFGMVPYRFSLSSDAFGKEKVKVRIVPVSDIIMTYNSKENWNKGLTFENQHAVITQSVNVNSSTLLEDVVIQYR